jgi:dihydroflavonol-4-reductase
MAAKYDNILITGASGSLGKQLIFEMVRRGCKPIALVRKESDTSFIDKHGLEKRVADLRQDTELAEAVRDIDAVIHTAAYVDFRGDRLTQFTGINTFGAVNLFKAAQKASVKRFLHVSTVAAVGAWPRNSSNNNSPRSPRVRVDEDFEFNLDRLKIPYIMTKRAAEVELVRLVEQGETELVTVNPSIIVAPSRSGDDRGKAHKRFGRFIMPRVPNRINLVDIRDAAKGVLAALEKGRPGERYILAGDNTTGRDLVLDISALLGRVPHLMRIPRGFLMALARFSAMWSRVMGKSKIGFYPDIIRLLDYDWAYTSMKARRELGYSNRSIHATLHDLLNNSFTGTYMKP